MNRTSCRTQDGFELRTTEFSLPADPGYLDPQTKRDLAICTLFLERGMSIADIISITDEDYETVVRALLRRRVVMDRRQKPRQSWKKRERRQFETES